MSAAEKLDQKVKANPSKAIKMLSIDDQSLSSKLDRAGYRDMGIQLITADSAAEALKKLAVERNMDVIVVNYDFHTISPLEFCQSLKRNPKFKDIPLILTSVQTSYAVQKKAFELGAALFIEQPLPRSLFIQKIKELLEQTYRKGGRIDGELGTASLVTASGEKIESAICDLSTTGVLLEINLPIGEKIEISLMIPRNKKPINAKGEVVRHVNSVVANDSSIKCGVKFTEFKNDGAAKLQDFVDKLNLDSRQMAYYL